MNYLYDGYLTIAGKYLLVAVATVTAIVLSSCGVGILLGVWING